MNEDFEILCTRNVLEKIRAEAERLKISEIKMCFSADTVYFIVDEKNIEKRIGLSAVLESLLKDAKIDILEKTYEDPHRLSDDHPETVSLLDTNVDDTIVKVTSLWNKHKANLEGSIKRPKK